MIRRLLLILTSVLIGCSPSMAAEDELINICEAELTKILRSPSGYERIDVTYSSEKISVEEYRDFRRQHAIDGWQRPNLEAIKEKQFQPAMLSVIIEYDAPNAFGALIRNFARCHYATENVKSAEIVDSGVVLNGLTKGERLRRALRSNAR